jgi:AraC-like DNA-binding protein
MRAKLEQLASAAGNQSFIRYEINVPSFEFFWHYHPEYELTYILQGKGKRFVGDSFEDFSRGDLVLLGPGLPHTWVSEKLNAQPGIALVIQFTSSFIEPLLQYKEMSVLHKLLVKADRGVKFESLKNQDTILLIKQLLNSKDADALICFFQLLLQLTSIKHKVLSSINFKSLKMNEDANRTNKVFQYVNDNFKNTVSLQKVSSMVHLSVSAFCKFFKRICGKTFSSYVNDIRIAHACMLLIETDKPISQIAFESGFESVTYFNRIFLKKKGVRPGEFRKVKS